MRSMIVTTAVVFMILAVLSSCQAQSSSSSDSSSSISDSISDSSSSSSSEEADILMLPLIKRSMRSRQQGGRLRN